MTNYLPTTPYVYIYMLQQVEYNPTLFREWLLRFPALNKVIKRQKLDVTKKAAMLLCVAYGIWILITSLSIFLFFVGEIIPAIILILITPLLVVISLQLISGIGFIFLQAARQKSLARASEKMKSHPGIKIAVLGSYGKTTMKEILATVLAEGKNVAVTPGNKNVAISHARWIENKLKGDEEVLIFELGEFRPGDIRELAKITQPDMAVITGIAPNHLENYASYDELKEDLKSIGLFVNPMNLYVDNNTSQKLGFTKGQQSEFNEQDVLGWKITDVTTELSGTEFVLSKDGKKLKLQSGIVGEHLVLPLAFAAALAGSLGLTEEQITEGIAKTRPFAHRMQPYQLNGAWIIDDTYNGNIEGMRAGLQMLKNLDGKKKVYVTPGLVEQGSETERVHVELGKYIVVANPDEVVLMKNSVEPFISASLEANNYPGKVTIVDDPKHYYENLQYHVADGDVYLMQNDWTDNYN